MIFNSIFLLKVIFPIFSGFDSFICLLKQQQKRFQSIQVIHTGDNFEIFHHNHHHHAEKLYIKYALKSWQLLQVITNESYCMLSSST